MAETRISKVIILECSAISRLGMVGLINSQADLRVCSETDDVSVARRLCVEQQPDLLVLDLELRRGDGLELLRELPDLSPSSRAVVLTNRDDCEALQRAFRTGAKAFVSKTDDPSELIAAIRAAVLGELFASRHISNLVLQFMACGQWQQKGGVSALSDRELQIFRLIATGKGAKAIAFELSLSVRTVEAHQAHIKDKLALKSSSELRRFAVNWIAQQSQKASTNSRGRGKN